MESDAKSIRKGLHMTQASFSDAFGFSLDVVKHWEGGRRTPEASARAFLSVTARNPEAVILALHPEKAPKSARTRSTHAIAAAQKRRWPPPQQDHLQRAGEMKSEFPERGGYQLTEFLERRATAGRIWTANGASQTTHFA